MFKLNKFKMQKKYTFNYNRSTFYATAPSGGATDISFLQSNFCGSEWHIQRIVVKKGMIQLADCLQMQMSLLMTAHSW